MLRIDLNADVGEGVGDDVGLFAIVTTANVAAGGHAGGGSLLQETVDHAIARGVVVGAHPSYPDRVGFGRHSMADDFSREALALVVAEQIRRVQSACAGRDSGVAHMKAHGALYNDAMRRAAVAEAVVDAAEATAVPVVLGQPRSALERACERRGVAFVAEAYADRAYEPDGSLVSRAEPGAVIHDADTVAERVLQLVTERTVVARDGTRIPIDAQTVCVHGDTADAVALARAVRDRLELHGVSIRPFART